MKWRKARLFLASLVILAGIFWGMSQPVAVEAAEERYYVSLDKLVQNSYGTNGATISWNLSYVSSSNTVRTKGYHIYLGANYNEYKLVGSTADTRYTFSGLADGKNYYVKVVPYAENGMEAEYGSTVTIKTMPKTVKHFRQEKWWFFIKKLDVTWDRIDTADNIVVTLYNSKGKKVGKSQSLSGSATHVTFDKMKDEVYTVKIQASATAGGKTYKTSVASIRCMNQARIKTLKIAKKKLTVTWGKVGGATGYDIYVSTNPKKGYKKVKSVGKKTNKVTISKFKKKAFQAKKTYYVYVETKIKKGKKTYKSGALYYWDTKTKNYGYKY